MQGESLSEILKVAAPLGGGVALALFIVAVVAFLGRRAIELRSDVVKRARPEDLQRVLGDELARLDIHAENLTKEQRYDLAVRMLEQRAARQTHIFAGALVVAVLSAVIALAGIFVERKPAPGNGQGSGDAAGRAAPGKGRGASEATEAGKAGRNSGDSAEPCAGPKVGALKAGEDAEVGVGVGAPCPSVGTIEATGRAKVDVGSAQ